MGGVLLGCRESERRGASRYEASIDTYRSVRMHICLGCVGGFNILEGGGGVRGMDHDAWSGRACWENAHRWSGGSGAWGHFLSAQLQMWRACVSEREHARVYEYASVCMYGGRGVVVYCVARTQQVRGSVDREIVDNRRGQCCTLIRMQ